MGSLPSSGITQFASPLLLVGDLIALCCASSCLAQCGYVEPNIPRRARYGTTKTRKCKCIRKRPRRHTQCGLGELFKSIHMHYYMQFWHAYARVAQP